MIYNLLLTLTYSYLESLPDKIYISFPNWQLHLGIKILREEPYRRKVRLSFVLSLISSSHLIDK